MKVGDNSTVALRDRDMLMTSALNDGKRNNLARH